MDAVLSHWLAIVASGCAVFVASFLAWAILPHHKPDFKKLKDVEAFRESLRTLGITPGQYMICDLDDPKKLKDPEFKKRWEAGPHGMLHVWSGAPSMARNMTLTLLFFLVASFFVAYVGSFNLGLDPTFKQIFRLTGTVGIMAYTMAFIPGAIWFGKSLRSVLMDLFDGVAYGLVTGVVFGLLW